MKKNKIITLGIIILLLAVTACAAVLHLSGRTEVSEGLLLVEHNGVKINITLSDVKTETVTGTIVNGKGEEKAIHSPGISLMQLLTDAGVTVAEKVRVVADDEYSADVTAAELSETGRVFLLIREGERPQLVVFGDDNSKRNVSGVIRLEVS